MIFERREPPLTQRFISCDRHCIGKVQAARAGNHRQAHAALWVLIEQIFRQTCVLPAENDIGIVRISDFGVDMRRFGGEIKEFTLVLFKKFRG